MQKPSIPKGTRDFSPDEMVKRNYIFDAIRSVFQKYGYLPIETPAMENLDTLLGKYGDEGDKLIFKILDSGDYFDTVKRNLLGDIFIKINSYFFDLIKMLIIQLIKDKADINNETIRNYIKEYFHPETVNSQDLNFNIKSSIFSYFKKDENVVNTVSTFLSKANISSQSQDSEIDFSLRILFEYQPLYKNLFDLLINQKSIDNELNLLIRKLYKINSSDVSKDITNKALHYDLTVPFARYVAQNRNEITFPFKRYQIQPVWRAERPQKGRYREFYQCDADVIGSDSILNEVELIQIIDEVFGKLNIQTTIKVNNRKILTGIADFIGYPERIGDITIAIDKLDKIGLEGVETELIKKGINKKAIEELKGYILVQTNDNKSRLGLLRSWLLDSQIGNDGIDEIELLFFYLEQLNINSKIEFELTLARGLDYYTGTIIEAITNGVQIGSVCGGGRYDNLTGIFGLPGVSGVGISFGADRIFDVMNQLNLYPPGVENTVRMLFVNFGRKEALYCLKLITKLREMNIVAELYPDAVKMKKQLSYANARKIPYVALIGEDEMKNERITLKNMATGEQTTIPSEELAKRIKV